MADMNDKIDVLNRFMGWEPGQQCDGLRKPVDDYEFGDVWCAKCNAVYGCGGHDIPPINPYADTPEAREWTRRLKDEFVRRMGFDAEVYTMRTGESLTYECMIDDDGPTWREIYRPIEHHAILDAIYEAIRQEK